MDYLHKTFSHVAQSHSLAPCPWPTFIKCHLITFSAQVGRFGAVSVAVAHLISILVWLTGRATHHMTTLITVLAM